MAPRNKLLMADATGTAMVARAADAVLASRARPVIAVLGHQADEVAAALGSRKLRMVRAPDYEPAFPPACVPAWPRCRPTPRPCWFASATCHW